MPHLPSQTSHFNVTLSRNELHYKIYGEIENLNLPEYTYGFIGRMCLQDDQNFRFSGTEGCNFYGSHRKNPLNFHKMRILPLIDAEI